ncbi:MAG: hypothetical protein U0835_24730 [Isosphaeraceae bacterium]
MTPGLFEAAPRPDPAHVARIKGWVAEALRLPEGAAVMVTQLQCREPGCPPLETVIAILDGSATNRKKTLHKAAADVSREDVDRLADGWN